MIRIAALREFTKSIASQAPPESAEAPCPPGATTISGEQAVRPRLLRCECRICGAHSNAVVTRDVRSSCPNCGASRLVPVEGAGVILAVQR